MKPLFLLALVGCLLIGCGKKENEVVSRPGQADVVMASKDDDALNAAIQKAKDTLPEFEARLAAAKPEEFFTLKAAFPTDSDGVEHIWVGDLVLEGGKFKGVLGNEPLDIARLKIGTPVTVERDKVSDWMIEKNGKFEGGFTADVLAKEAGEPLLPR